MRKITKILYFSLLVTPVISFAEAYVGLGAGLGFVNTQSVVISNASQFSAAAGGATTTYSYNRRIGVGRAYLGFKVHKNIDVEVVYFASSNVNISYANTSGAVNQASSVKGGDLSFIFRPQETGLFLRAGAHRSQITNNFSVGMVGVPTNLNNKQTGTGYLLGIGYTGEIAQDIDWQAEYTYMHNLGGVAGVNVNTVSMGINKKFK